MKQYLIDTKAYITEHKSEFIIGVSILFGAIIVISIIAWTIHASSPKVVYQPAKACDLFTFAEAKDLLGDKTIQSGGESPMVSRNTATSKCGYSDGNPTADDMIVAAVVVRSGVNDNGVIQNKNDFAAAKPSQNVETVSAIGEQAYFDKERGQLNVLNDKQWIILSIGVGSAPQGNTIEKAVDMARKILGVDKSA